MSSGPHEWSSEPDDVPEGVPLERQRPQNEDEGGHPGDAASAWWAPGGTAPDGTPAPDDAPAPDYVPRRSADDLPVPGEQVGPDGSRPDYPSFAWTPDAMPAGGADPAAGADRIPPGEAPYGSDEPAFGYGVAQPAPPDGDYPAQHASAPPAAAEPAYGAATFSDPSHTDPANTGSGYTGSGYAAQPSPHPAYDRSPYPQQPYATPQDQPAYPQQQSYPEQNHAQQAPPQAYGHQASQAFQASQASQAPLAPPAAPPAVPPRPEDLLAPSESTLVAPPAAWGWRGRLHRASGGLVKPKATPAEVTARRAEGDIKRSFSRPMTVVVVQPKGGAGKTPTTICLSAAFGAHRGGYVVGWDDNETRGTLAVRVSNPDGKKATVWDLLSDLAAFERYDARVGDLSYYVRSQPDSHFDALVSDDNPANMSQIGEDEYQRMHRVLQRFYRLIVVDTGNNVRSPNWQAAVNSADLVVVVSSYQRDVGYSASWVLDHLAQTGREELARNAVTVLTAADPTIDKEVRGQLVQHFGARTRAVIEIPYDNELAHGGPIRWTQLQQATRTAWTQAGATVANCLAEHDEAALAARRT